MENLKFTALEIYKIEKARNMPLADMLQDRTLENIAIIIQYGLKLNSLEEALEVIQKEIEKVGGYDAIQNIAIEIVTSLTDSGFLPSTPQMEKLVKAHKASKVTEAKKSL
jgi:hypothetical protein